MLQKWIYVAPSKCLCKSVDYFKNKNEFANINLKQSQSQYYIFFEITGWLTSYVKVTCNNIVNVSY